MLTRGRAWAVEQGPLGCLAWALLLVAFAASFSHLRTFAQAHGQVGWLAVAFALLPDLLVWGSLTKLRTERLSGWGRLAVAVTLLLAAAGTLSANLATAKPGGDGMVDVADRLTAIAPVVGAILATVLAEVRGERRISAGPAPVPVVVAETSVPLTAPLAAIETAVPDPVAGGVGDGPPTTEPAPAAPETGEPAPALPRRPARVAAPRRKPAAKPVRRTDAELLAQVSDLVDRGELAAEDVTGNRLRDLLSIGGERGKRLAEAWTEQHRRDVVRPLRSATGD